MNQHYERERLAKGQSVPQGLRPGDRLGVSGQGDKKVSAWLSAVGLKAVLVSVPGGPHTDHGRTEGAAVLDR